uniref:Cell wall surface anchored protein n=1 Tax=Solanum tuberosum TaxID=4113 RepID=M1DL89_SOLTU
MLRGVDPVLKTSLSAEAKGFSYVDGFNWAITLSTISAMFSFAAFVGDFTCFGDKPKTVADSDGTREACCPSNLAWFLVIGPTLPVVTLRMFSTSMQNLDLSVFADTDANTDFDVDADFNADGDFDPDADMDVDPDLDADTDVDPDLDANVDFELIYLKVISVFLNFGCLEEKR